MTDRPGSAAKADVVVIIPARGGSKGVPRKNVRDVAGRPLIAWSIAAGLEAARVGRVYVSTEDAEIKRVALAAGDAEGVWRARVRLDELEARVGQPSAGRFGRVARG